MKDYSVIDGILKDTKDKIKFVFDKGYKQGYVDGNKICDDCKDTMEAEYNRGLNDAWEAAKKIVLPSDMGGMDSIDMARILPVKNKRHQSLYDVLKTYTALEVVTKINEYKEMQKTNNEIKTGDEVTHINLKYTGVVIGVEGNVYRIMWSDNNFSGEYESSLQKTGKHYDAMAEILEQLKGENTDA